VNAGPLEGRVAVVTGGTSGIGLEIVRGLASQGARTLLIGRGAARVEQIAEELRRSIGHPDIEGIAVADLAVRGSWSDVAAEVARRTPRVHILVNNAGAVFTDRAVTVDGLERTFALNVLAPLALTTRLAGALCAAAPARVVNVASAAHMGYHVDLEDLQSLVAYSGFRTYGHSKLELILLSRELALRFAGSGVTVNSVHPGFVRSGFGLNNRGGLALAIRVLGALAGRSPRRGATTPLLVATDPALEHVSGEYFSGGHVATGSSESRDLVMARQLYERCCLLAGVPEIPRPPALRPATS
jgi:NAD(P)-dependent dehydrogenase (short-subunit alcohol dehydrogenase family)